MNYTCVVQQQHRPRLNQHEALSRGPGGVKHVRFSAIDRLLVHHEHGDHVHTVAVRTFRRGPTDTIGGIDAKLVHLDLPWLHITQA